MKFPTDCIKLSRSFGCTVILLQPFTVVQFSLRISHRFRIQRWLGWAFLVLGPSLSTFASEFHGAAAFAQTRQAVSFGQRPSGSASLNKLRDWIISQFKTIGGQFSADSFQGQTPSGPIPMTNLILKFPGTTGKAIVVTGDYDTKKQPDGELRRGQ